MIQISEKEVWTDAPEMRIHRKDSESYFSRCTLLQGETADSFEEVRLEDIPTGPEPFGKEVRG